ncbi:MAG: hypothetical protein AAFS10_03895 [Myxococcota bacterium]
MRVPVVVLDGVYLPGVPGEIEVERHTAEALSTFGTLEGFGCLEVLLASPLEHGEGLAPLGALVEMVVPEEALAGDTEHVRLEVGEGHRVAVLNPETVETIYGTAWHGTLASFESHKPTCTGLTTEAWAELRVALYRHVLAMPTDLPGPRVSSDALLEAIAGPVLEVERLQAPDWKVAYMAADRTLLHPQERYRMLSLPDAGQACIELGILDRLHTGSGSETEAMGHYADLLEEILDTKLHHARLAIEALALMARQEVVELPGGTSRTLRDLDRDFEQLMATLEGLVAQIEQRRGR